MYKGSIHTHTYLQDRVNKLHANVLSDFALKATWQKC